MSSAMPCVIRGPVPLSTSCSKLPVTLRSSSCAIMARVFPIPSSSGSFHRSTASNPIGTARPAAWAWGWPSLDVRSPSTVARSPPPTLPSAVSSSLSAFRVGTKCQGSTELGAGFVTILEGERPAALPLFQQVCAAALHKGFHAALALADTRLERLEAIQLPCVSLDVRGNDRLISANQRFDSVPIEPALCDFTNVGQVAPAQVGHGQEARAKRFGRVVDADERIEIRTALHEWRREYSSSRKTGRRLEVRWQCTARWQSRRKPAPAASAASATRAFRSERLV